MAKIETPDEFTCPVTMSLIKDAVKIAGDTNHLFEHASLLKELTNPTPKSPLTRKPFSQKDIITDPTYPTALAAWKKTNNIASTQAVFAAIKTGRVENLEKLNYFEEHLESTNEQGQTMLEAAAEVGGLALVKLIYDHTTLQEHKTVGKGLSAMLFAVSKGHQAVAEFLYSKDHKCLADLGADGESALHVAAAYGQAGIIPWLVTRGLVVDTVNHIGMTPLIVAALYGHLTAVNELLRLKAKINAQDANGCTAIIRAAYNGHLPVVQYLMSQRAGLVGGNGITALHVAADNGKDLMVNFIAGANPELLEYSDNNGDVPLAYAARCNRPTTVSTLLTQHLAQNRPFHQAAKNAMQIAFSGDIQHPVFTEVLEEMIKTCPQLLTSDDFKETMRRHVITQCSFDALAYLLKIDPAALTCFLGPEMNTLLHIAVMYHNKSAVSLLLSAGIDAETTNREGRPAIDYSSSPEISLLIKSHIEEQKRIYRQMPARMDALEKMVRELIAENAKLREEVKALSVNKPAKEQRNPNSFFPDAPPSDKDKQAPEKLFCSALNK